LWRYFAPLWRGKAGGPFKADGIRKRLVSLQARRRFKTETHTTTIKTNVETGPDPDWGEHQGQQTVTETVEVEIEPHFLYILVPEDGLGWRWYTHAHWATIQDTAMEDNSRVVHLSAYDDERFSAVLVANKS
jgi:hypothetical protein